LNALDEVPETCHARSFLAVNSHPFPPPPMLTRRMGSRHSTKGCNRLLPLLAVKICLLSCTALHCTVRCCIALALAPYPALALTQLPFSYKVVFQIAGSDGARPVRRSSCRICIHSFLSTPPTNPLAQVASAGPRRQRICKGSRKRKSRPVRVSWHVCHFRCCVFHFRIRSQILQKP
jgi:hypothetical protein